jgi:serine/threonine protein phosphatase PrpC
VDAHLFFRGQLRNPVLVPVAGGTAVVFTEPAPTRVEDEPNEDAVGVFGLGPEAAVLAVADGVGGHGRGDLGSRTALEALAEQLAEVDAEDLDLRDPIMSAIEQANARLLAHNPSPATTLVVATILRGQLRCYTVGDSELMVVGQRGKLKLRTIPHSPIGYARESGLLDETSALLHDERHLLSNVIGMPGMHVAATTGMRLAPRDTVLLGSDGIFDNLYHDEIIEIVRAGEPLATAERLVDSLRKRMAAGPSREPEIPSKPDDVAFVLFRTQPPSAVTHAKARRTDGDEQVAEAPAGTPVVN